MASFDLTQPDTSYSQVSYDFNGGDRGYLSCCIIDSYKVVNLEIGGSSLFQNVWLADR